jgi:hypothetical protein
MQVEKNIFDSIITTLLDIPGKIKDHENARKDINQGKHVMFAKACFSMTKNEKSIFCDCWLQDP